MRFCGRTVSPLMAAKSSTAAMTELHFLLDVDEQMSRALTYRIHACELLEVWGDERSWHGVSPWIDHRAEIKLSLSGTVESLPSLANRAPTFGFNDYAEAVKDVASVRRRPKATVLELGEETTNAHRRNRRLLSLAERSGGSRRGVGRGHRASSHGGALQAAGGRA